MVTPPSSAVIETKGNISDTVHVNTQVTTMYIHVPVYQNISCTCTYQGHSQDFLEGDSDLKCTYVFREKLGYTSPAARLNENNAYFSQERRYRVLNNRYS